MATKLDMQFANGVKDGVNALILEVQRLEGILENIEKLIDPSPSPGGDTEWLVSNYVKNVTEELERLRGNQKPVTPA